MSKITPELEGGHPRKACHSGNRVNNATIQGHDLINAEHHREYALQSTVSSKLASNCISMY
jgi:hypothetical protein